MFSQRNKKHIDQDTTHTQSCEELAQYSGLTRYPSGGEANHDKMQNISI